MSKVVLTAHGISSKQVEEHRPIMFVTQQFNTSHLNNSIVRTKTKKHEKLSISKGSPSKCICIIAINGSPWSWTRIVILRQSAVSSYASSSHRCWFITATTVKSWIKVEYAILKGTVGYFSGALVMDALLPNFHLLLHTTFVKF